MDNNEYTYFVTPTILNSFKNISKYGFQSFVDTLTRKKVENEYINAGLQLEKALEPQSKKIGSTQVFGEKRLKFGDYTFNLYGYADILTFDGEIIDIKWKKNYEAGAFRHSVQHSIYQYIFSDEEHSALPFHYYIFTGDIKGKNLASRDLKNPDFIESYSLSKNSLQFLKNDLLDFVSFLEREKTLKYLYDINTSKAKNPRIESAKEFKLDELATLKNTVPNLSIPEMLFLRDKISNGEILVNLYAGQFYTPGESYPK